MRRLIVLFMMLLLCGCSNKLEDNKKEYLDFKNKIKNIDEFTEEENIPFNVNVTFSKLTSDEIRYQVIIENPKEDIEDLKALVIHDQATEDVYPSVGIFDDDVDLLVEEKDRDARGVILVGYIPTMKSVEEVDIEVRVIIEYTDINDESVFVYYKATN